MAMATTTTTTYLPTYLPTYERHLSPQALATAAVVGQSPKAVGPSDCSMPPTLIAPPPPLPPGPVRLKTTNQEVDPCFQCRLCRIRPYLDQLASSVDPLDSLTSEDALVDDAARKRVVDPADPLCVRPLAWVTHKMCHNCNVVIIVVYIDGGDPRFIGLGPALVIRKVEASAPLLSDFRLRKDSYNAALRGCVSFMGQQFSQPIVSMFPGSHVVVEQLNDEVEEHSPYEWLPLKTYEAIHGNPDTNNKGHSRLSRHGKAGVAMFYLHPDAVKVTARSITRATKVTCVSATAAGMEVFPGQVSTAFADASSPFNTRLKEILDVRRSKSEETLVGDALTSAAVHAIMQTLAKSGICVSEDAAEETRSVGGFTLAAKTLRGGAGPGGKGQDPDTGSNGGAMSGGESDDEVYGRLVVGSSAELAREAMASHRKLLGVQAPPPAKKAGARGGGGGGEKKERRSSVQQPQQQQEHSSDTAEPTFDRRTCLQYLNQGLRAELVRWMAQFQALAKSGSLTALAADKVLALKNIHLQQKVRAALALVQRANPQNAAKLDKQLEETLLALLHPLADPATATTSGTLHAVDQSQRDFAAASAFLVPSLNMIVQLQLPTSSQQTDDPIIGTIQLGPYLTFLTTVDLNKFGESCPETVNVLKCLRVLLSFLNKYSIASTDVSADLIDAVSWITRYPWVHLFV